MTDERADESTRAAPVIGARLDVPVDDRETTLKMAAGEARAALAYLSRQGINVEAADLQALLECLGKIETDKLDTKSETVFWTQYASLAKKAQPAQVDTIYFFEQKQKKGEIDNSFVMRHTRNLSFISFSATIVFIITMVFLAYISVSESLVADNIRLGQEYVNLNNDVVEGTEVASLVTEADRRLIPVDSGGSAEGGNEASEGGGQAEIPEDLQAPSNDAGTVAVKVEWNAKASGLINARISQIRDLVTSNDGVLDAMRLTWLFNALFPRSTGESASQIGLLPYDVPGIAAQRNVNRIISNYVLPLLAAMLGVFVYITKTGTERIEKLSFRAHTVGVYGQRFVLGVIGGIVISWFGVGEEGGLLSTITPLALAFLVGYSVDVLYNILDSLVSSLSGRKSES